MISFDLISSEDLAQKDQRSLIFHLLYAADSYNYEISLENIADNFLKGFDIVINQESQVFQIAQEIIKNHEAIDKYFLPLISSKWRFERLGTVTKLILRMGIWELLNSKTDPAIIINESVELAKCFAEKDAHKFVNGVLDEFSKKLISKNTEKNS